jgi:hypothetical protein
MRRLVAFRQMYLFTLGCRLTHSAYSSRQARRLIAALDPSDFPVLTAHTDIIAGRIAVAERDVFRTGLRNLIAAAERVSWQQH